MAPRDTTDYGMSIDEVLELPVVFDLDTANRALSIGRTTGYSLAKHGEYPIPVHRFGNVYKVMRADLFKILGIEQ